MNGDVSQFIQMQRLRSLQARQPTINDKSLTHLYQPQVTTSGITEFLRNPKTKITHSSTIVRNHYIPGSQAKSRIPGGNVRGEI